MIEIRIDGQVLENFWSISMIDSVDQLCNQFKAKCCVDDGSQVFPISKGSAFQVVVGDTLLMTGIVEIVRGGYSENKYEIEVEGRDITRAVLKNDLPPDFSIKGPVSLKAVMEKTLKASNVALNVIDESSGITDFTSKELLTDDVGASIWDFWSGLREKRKVLISKDPDGNVVISNPNGKEYSSGLFQLFNDPDALNNIVSANWVFDDSERRNEVNVRSQANMSVARDDAPPADNEQWAPDDSPEPPSSLQSEAQVDALIQKISESEFGSEVQKAYQKQLSALLGASPVKAQIKSRRTQTRGRAIDPGAEPLTVSYETAENPSDDDECQRLAEWRVNQNRVASNSFSCTVQQLLIDGRPWQSGYLVPTVDEQANVDSMMLINRVEYQTEVQDGQLVSENVRLALTVPDGYSQEASASDAQSQTGDIGDKWTGGGYQ